MWQKFYYSKKGADKSFDIDIGRGTESVPHLLKKIFLC